MADPDSFVITTGSRCLLSLFPQFLSFSWRLREIECSSPSSGKLALFAPVLATWSMDFTSAVATRNMPGEKGKELIRTARVKPQDTSEGPVIDDVPERKDGRHLNRHPQPKLDR